MPPVHPDARHLLDWLMECGPSMPGAMGAVALTWSEIRQWAATTGRPITPASASILRRLSAEYVSTLHRSAEPDAPEPYAGDDDTIARRRAMVSRKIGAILGGR